jgi:hypothetical protein
VMLAARAGGMVRSVVRSGRRSSLAAQQRRDR